jgi:hypothetical protein
MKGMRIIAVLLALACIGFAGWKTYSWWSEDQAQKGPPITKRPAPPVAVRPPLPPLKRPATFVLTSLPKWEPQTLSEGEWKQAYSAFTHEPFDKSGFSAVALPWRFAATPDAPESNGAIAHALAFLLSYDLDWSPASYDSRHGYSFFKASEKLPDKETGSYEPERVAALLRNGNATHAITGLLVRGKDGYVATLQIFDRDGKMVHEKEFEQPREFFQVLGDVSCDALSYFGTPGNEALNKHLHRARCRRMGVLDQLGRAALLEAGSLDELAIYNKVLTEEPGFTEVRLCRADLRLAEQGDPKAYADEQLQALRAGPSATALADFRPEYCTEPPTSSRMMQSVEQAAELAGADHPTIVAWRLKAFSPGDRAALGPALCRSDMKPYIAAAGRHPNHRPLLLTLLRAYKPDHYTPSIAPYDPEMVASLALASATNRAAAGSHGYEWYRITEAAHAMGRPHHVLAAARQLLQDPGDLQHIIACQEWIADAQMQLGHFSEAATLFTKVAKVERSGGQREHTIDRLGICAVLANQPELLDEVAADPRISAGRSGEFLLGCGKYLSGAVITRGDFPTEFNYGDYRLLLAEAELAQGGDFSRSDRRSTWSEWVTGYVDVPNRLRWALMEQYYRAQPALPHRAGFYEAAEWQFPDDPMVTAAVAAWRKAGGGPVLPTTDEVHANVTKRQWSGNERMPIWTSIARVRRELEEGRIDQAERLVKALDERYSTDPAPIAWLARKVEQAKKQPTTKGS